MRFSLLSLSLVGVLLLPLGCRKGEPDQKHVLEFWHIQSYDPTKPAVEAAVQRAQAAGTDLEIRAEAMKNDAFKTKLATAMGARTTPDVFHTWGGGILADYAKANRVLRLDPAKLGSLDRFTPAALDFCRVDGNLYALPVDVSIVPIWYNTRLFERAGIVPPKTWDDFLAACQALRAQGITPLALGNAQSWPGAFYFVYLATRLGGPEPIQARRFQDPAFIEAGNKVRELVAANVFNKGFNGLSNDDAQRLFFNEEAAMILMGSWLLAHLQTQAPELSPFVKSFPFPELGRKAAWDNTIVGGVNAAYAISADTKFPDDAYSLLRHLTDDKAMTEWAATGRIPALSQDAVQGVLGTTPPVAEALYQATSIQLYYDQLLSPPLAAAHKETTQALLALSMTAEEAAKTMADTAARTAP